MGATTDVLAIDDDKFARKIISRIFAGTDIECRLAESGGKGLEETVRKVPDVILLDVEMPRINGYEVCDRLRNNMSTADIPIIFLSGRSSLQERMQGYDAGGDDYLVKPFESDDLLAKIKELSRYKKQCGELKEKFHFAQKTALVAMTSTSHLGTAMGFMEKIYSYKTTEDLAKGLFQVTDKLGIECTMRDHHAR